MSINVYSTEVDHYSTSHLLIKDSTKRVNEIINFEVNDVVNEVNDSRDCDHKSLSLIGQKLVSRFQGLGWRAIPKIESFISDELFGDQKIQISKENSMYNDFGFSEGFAMGLGLGCCSDIIKIDNVRIGTDKLGHFFLEGYYFYKDSKIESKSHLRKLERAFLTQLGAQKKLSYETMKVHSMNRLSEENLFGFNMTGVYSYADKIANFEGVKFWKELLSESSPYIKCISGKSKLIKQIDLRDYVNPMWDESINCNTYKTEKGEEALQVATDLSSYPNCPRVPTECLAAKKHYGKHAKHLLHPECFKVNALQNKKDR